MDKEFYVSVELYVSAKAASALRKVRSTLHAPRPALHHPSSPSLPPRPHPFAPLPRSRSQILLLPPSRPA